MQRAGGAAVDGVGEGWMGVITLRVKKQGWMGSGGDHCTGQGGVKTLAMMTALERQEWPVRVGEGTVGEQALTMAWMGCGRPRRKRLGRYMTPG